jgi:hypothetical protein
MLLMVIVESFASLQREASQSLPPRRATRKLFRRSIHHPQPRRGRNCFCSLGHKFTEQRVPVKEEDEHKPEPRCQNRISKEIAFLPSTCQWCYTAVKYYLRLTSSTATFILKILRISISIVVVNEHISLL